MSIYSEFDVEFNGNSPMNRNEPQQIEIFGPAGLEKNVNKSIAEFLSIFSLSAMACMLGHISVALKPIHIVL